MGVPAFFRWLTRKYPSVIATCVEEKNTTSDGVRAPVDATQPNPNGVEFDNLYLDMNGIIHPCTHPEDKPAPKDEDEMMVAIFECIDRLFNIVRPRKLLYMAIDGVAPRAKMNQQRSRRFRASKETTEKVQEIARLRSDLAAKGCILPPEKPKENHFDSNCITPGTPFMARLSACLHFFIHDRMNNNPAWKGIKVILSDANVPGEGEHKIMDYIRRQRAQPDYDPNTHHCLCGADADLIMLGLATHEPNFTIIREEFIPHKDRPCDICNQMGHEMKDCVGLEKPQSAKDMIQFGSEVEFIFVRLNVLREYLEKELTMPNLPFPYDFERAVDDWVFMCFFVGNDFLPHLPSLEIREGAIDRLVELYKKTVYKTGGFLTDSGYVKLDRVQLIMQDLGGVEDQIFKMRQKNEISFRQRAKAKKRRTQLQNWKPQWTPVGQFAPIAVGGSVAPVQNARQEAYQMRMQGMHTNSRTGLGSSQDDGSDQRGVKRKSDQMGNNSDSDEEPPDEVRLWEDGFKDRYYESKFDVDPHNIDFRVKVAHEYVIGLCWVLRYYYQGCASWKWYFPYHYAPFASDFINVGDMKVDFEKGTVPFRPLEQLMGVFPAASSAHVPPSWAPLMSDPDSPIIDFYPEDFKIDLNGKKFAWQGVALLPFVEEKRLFKALEPYYGQLTPEEVRRNIRGDDRLYMAPKNEGYKFVTGLYSNDVEDEVAISVDGIYGQVLLSKDCILNGGELNSPVRGLAAVTENTVVTICFRDPKYPDTFIFPAKRLPKAKEAPRVLKPGDLSAVDNRNFRPQLGMAPAKQRASLGSAGHRMLGHQGIGRDRSFSAGATVNSQFGQGIYSAVPPTALLSSMPQNIYVNPFALGTGGGRGNRNNRNDNRDRAANFGNAYGGSGSGGNSYRGGNSYGGGGNSYGGGGNSYGGGSRGSGGYDNNRNSGGGSSGNHWSSRSSNNSYGYNSVTGPSGYASSSQGYQSGYSSGRSGGQQQYGGQQYGGQQQQRGAGGSSGNWYSGNRQSEQYSSNRYRSHSDKGRYNY